MIKVTLHKCDQIPQVTPGFNGINAPVTFEIGNANDLANAGNLESPRTGSTPRSRRDNFRAKFGKGGAGMGGGGDGPNVISPQFEVELSQER